MKNAPQPECPATTSKYWPIALHTNGREPMHRIQHTKETVHISIYFVHLSIPFHFSSRSHCAHSNLTIVSILISFFPSRLGLDDFIAQQNFQFFKFQFSKLKLFLLTFFCIQDFITISVIYRYTLTHQTNYRRKKKKITKRYSVYDANRLVRLRKVF